MSAHLSKNHINQNYFGNVVLQVYLYTEKSKRFKENLYEFQAPSIRFSKQQAIMDPIKTALLLLQQKSSNHRTFYFYSQSIIYIISISKHYQHKLVLLASNRVIYVLPSTSGETTLKKGSFDTSFTKCRHIILKALEI